MTPKKNYILFNKNVYLKPFEKKDLTKKYIQMLNREKVNQYLRVRHHTQNLLTVRKYLKKFKSKNDFFWIVKKNKKTGIIGTGSIRIRNSNGLVGYMIGIDKYKGSVHSRDGFKIMLDHVFKEYKLKTITGNNVKKNISANFNLINNNIKLKKTNKKTFKFILNKRDWKQNISYEKSAVYSLL